MLYSKVPRVMHFKINRSTFYYYIICIEFPEQEKNVYGKECACACACARAGVCTIETENFILTSSQVARLLPLTPKTPRLVLSSSHQHWRSAQLQTLELDFLLLQSIRASSSDTLKIKHSVLVVTLTVCEVKETKKQQRQQAMRMIRTTLAINWLDQLSYWKGLLQRTRNWRYK